MNQPIATSPSPSGHPGPVGGSRRTSHPRSIAAHPPGGLAEHRAKTQRTRTLCRVTRIKTDHPAGRMAHAIIGEMIHSGTATLGHLKRGGWTDAEISQHRDAALAIARSHKPELFAGAFDMVA